jgi:hypothetical protein
LRKCDNSWESVTIVKKVQQKLGKCIKVKKVWQKLRKYEKVVQIILKLIKYIPPKAEEQKSRNCRQNQNSDTVKEQNSPKKVSHVWMAPLTYAFGKIEQSFKV